MSKSRYCDVKEVGQVLTLRKVDRNSQQEVFYNVIEIEEAGSGLEGVGAARIRWSKCRKLGKLEEIVHEVRNSVSSKNNGAAQAKALRVLAWQSQEGAIYFGEERVQEAVEARPKQREGFLDLWRTDTQRTTVVCEASQVVREVRTSCDFYSFEFALRVSQQASLYRDHGMGGDTEARRYKGAF